MQTCVSRSDPHTALTPADVASQEEQRGVAREPVPVDLAGVSATLLSNLARRAAAARAKRPLLDDPLAVEAVERLDYDFADVSARGASWHALRVATFDGAVRSFLKRNPDGLVVALGEGLETQFWRVDNGRMHWLTVELPPVLDLRRRVLPEEPRLQSHSGSALDLGWVDELEPGMPVLVTAQGLFPYFGREQVHALIATLAERVPGSSLVFDVVPERMLELVRKTSGRERDQAVELWTWLFSVDERGAIAEIPGVARLRDLSPPFALGFVPLVLRAVRCLPRRLRYSLPVLPVLEARFANR
jgi:O-methyltransferase involved in polyketide biosynthesis